MSPSTRLEAPVDGRPAAGRQADGRRDKAGCVCRLAAAAPGPRIRLRRHGDQQAYDHAWTRDKHLPGSNA